MKQMQNSAPQAVSKLPGSMSLAASSRLGTMLATAALLLALALPGMAKDNLLGTPGALQVDDGYIFTNNTASTNQGIKVNSTSWVSGALGSGSEWWAAKPVPFGIVDETTPADEIVAHVTDPLKAGDTYWMSMSFEYPQTNYKGVVRGNQTGLFLPGTENKVGGLPSPTEIYIGLQFYNDDLSDFDDFDSSRYSVVNLAPLTTGHNDTPTAADGFQAGQIPDLMTKWYNYEITSGGGQWEFKVDMDGTDQTKSLLANWVVGVVLPEGFGGSTYTDSVFIDGYDKNGDPIRVGPGDDYYGTVDGDGGPKLTHVVDISNDIFFRWTVDEKGIPVDDPTSVNYNNGDFPKNPDFENDLFAPDPVVVIPEPSSSVLVMLGTLALIMRRKRS